MIDDHTASNEISFLDRHFCSLTSPVTPSSLTYNLVSSMASIGDPFVLSTYSQPKGATRAGPSGLSNVFASNQHASTSSSEGYVTVAAQGDGVHVLDVS